MCLARQHFLEHAPRFAAKDVAHSARAHPPRSCTVMARDELSRRQMQEHRERTRGGSAAFTRRPAKKKSVSVCDAHPCRQVLCGDRSPLETRSITARNPTDHRTKPDRSPLETRSITARNPTDHRSKPDRSPLETRSRWCDRRSRSPSKRTARHARCPWRATGALRVLSSRMAAIAERMRSQWSSDRDRPTVGAPVVRRAVTDPSTGRSIGAAARENRAGRSLW
jgi:hypothetical protein